MTVKTLWTIEKLKHVYQTSLIKLITKAMFTHKQHHKIGEVQVCHLISIKTGGCSEDCKYCAQSSRYQTNVKAESMMKHADVIKQAKKAISNGATRICLGAAWKGVRDSNQFEKTLNMVKEIAKLNVEVCCTLGILNNTQAKKLKAAGLYAYNHNLDSSESFYKTIITTRSYQDRLNTLDEVVKANLSVCSGGIIGMGETVQDRLELLLTLSKRSDHLESVPINRLIPIKGTPLENQPTVSIWELIRLIAVTRIVMPKTMIRLSAGRIEMSIQEQALAFLAGANSIFAGEKLLTVINNSASGDAKMFQILGLTKQKAYVNQK
jgi:biotin synthase